MYYVCVMLDAKEPGLVTKIFTTIKDYDSMLTRLNWTTLIISSIYSIILESYGFLPFKPLSEKIITPIPIINWFISFGYWPCILIVIMWLLSVVEFHNKISKIIGLRYIWDKYYIVKPMYSISGMEAQFKFLKRSQVENIMNCFFYKEVKTIEEHYKIIFWRYAVWSWVFFEHTFLIIISLILTVFLFHTFKFSLLWYFIFVVILTNCHIFFVAASKSTDEVKAIDEDRIKAFLLEFINR